MAPPIQNRIAVLRAERGLSRQQLSDALGINYQTIGYLERGDYNPSLRAGFQDRRVLRPAAGGRLLAPAVCPDEQPALSEGGIGMIDDFDKLSVTELRQRGMTSDKILAEQKRRGMSKQQINDAWYPRPPTYNRIGSRRFRRRLVLATYGGWLLVAAIFLLASMILSTVVPGL